MVAVSIVAVGGTLATLIAAMPPQEGAPLVVITPPWKSAEALVALHDGHAILPWQAAGMAVLASFDSDLPLDARVSDLREGGAWAVIDGQRIAEICGAS